MTWFGSARLRCLIAAALLFASPAAGQGTAEEAGTAAPPVDTYEVVAGDTLWAISSRFLGTPWAWPKLWSFNPEITNPHWIYPGDIVRFFPPAVDLPSVTQLVASHRELPEDDEPAAPERLVVDDEPHIEVIRTAPAKLPPALPRFVGLFVTDAELAEAGTLVNSTESRLLLSAQDQVYLSFPKGRLPSPGTRYLTYVTLGKVRHPITGQAWGYLTQVTGLTAVTSVDEEVARARVLASFREIERGQYVTPLLPGLLDPVVPKPARRQVRGVVLAAESHLGSIVGEGQIVFIDKGTDDGLERGNRLHVLMRGDPYTREEKGLPPSVIGELMVVEANERAATCQIIDSVQEIRPGDPVVARTVLGGGAARRSGAGWVAAP